MKETCIEFKMGPDSTSNQDSPEMEQDSHSAEEVDLAILMKYAGSSFCAT